MYRTLLIAYCAVLSPHFICTTAYVPDDRTTAVSSWNALRGIGRGRNNFSFVNGWLW